jgi:hypothetical protein
VHHSHHHCHRHILTNATTAITTATATLGGLAVRVKATDGCGDWRSDGRGDGRPLSGASVSIEVISVPRGRIDGRHPSPLQLHRWLTYAAWGARTDASAKCERGAGRSPVDQPPTTLEFTMSPVDHPPTTLAFTVKRTSNWLLKLGFQTNICQPVGTKVHMKIKVQVVGKVLHWWMLQQWLH